MPRPLREAGQVFLCGRIVGKHFEHLSDLDRVHLLARLE